MTARRDSMIEIVKALAGPMVWAAHFFFLYLVEAFACAAHGVSTGAVRWVGISATAVALGALALLALGSTRASSSPREGTVQDGSPAALARPRILLSMVAIVWTSAPLLLLPACMPAYHTMPGG